MRVASGLLQRHSAAALPSRAFRRHVPICPRKQIDQKHLERHRIAPQAVMTPLYVALAGVGVAALAAWIDALLKSKKPALTYAATTFNAAVLSRCPTLHNVYRCTPFLTNGHVETIVVAKTRSAPGVDYKREILLTKDGGAVAVDWEHFDDEGHDLPADAPVLILFPGLTGGSGDSYVQHAVLQARHAGIRAAVFNSRGTADSPVITPQFYSASFTEDTREVIDYVRQRYPQSTLFAAGWSLGANILVNYLGEQGSNTPLEAAVSMCNPFDLTISNRYISQGFNKLYDWNLANSLKRIFLKHQLVWKGHRGPAKPHLVPSVSSIREFDEAITVHSFSWDDVDAYYDGSSSSKRIPDVSIPLLCIQALDDPIAPAEAIPYDAIAANSNCVLAVTPCGGHLGWAAGPGAPFGEPWTDGAVFEWLSSVHTELLKKKAQQQQQRGKGDSNGSSGPPGGDGDRQQQVVGKGKQRQPERVAVTASSTSTSSREGSQAAVGFVASASAAAAGTSSSSSNGVRQRHVNTTHAVSAALVETQQQPSTVLETTETPQLHQGRQQQPSSSSPASDLKQRQPQLAAAAAAAAQAELLANQLRWAF